MATSMATQGENKPAVQTPKDVRSLIMSDAFQSQIRKAMPESMSPDILLRVAVTTIQKTPKLLECSQASLMQCVLECAQLGLLPDGFLGQAYLVPYKGVATLQIGYKGILELARRSNQTKYVVAEAVYACDEFKIEFAPVRSIKHVPDIDNEQRGEILQGKYLPEGFRGAYALVIYKDDTIDFEYMPLHQIERIRKKSQAGSKDDAPWLTSFEEMAKKTAIRKLGKRLPLSADDQRNLIQDEYRESGIDVGHTIDAGIESLVKDEEAERMMEALGWSETKKLMCRRNFNGDRDALVKHLQGQITSAGITVEHKQIAESEPEREDDTTAQPADDKASEATIFELQPSENPVEEKKTPTGDATTRTTTAAASTSQAKGKSKWEDM